MRINFDAIRRLFGAKAGDKVAVRYPGGTFINGKQVSALTPDQLERVQFRRFGGDNPTILFADPYDQLGKHRP
jgi:hypothetical protein